MISASYLCASTEKKKKSIANLPVPFEGRSLLPVCICVYVAIERRNSTTTLTTTEVMIAESGEQQQEPIPKGPSLSVNVGRQCICARGSGCGDDTHARVGSTGAAR